MLELRFAIFIRTENMDYNIGDRVTTKKTHACGGNEWEIIRTGADIKIKCLTCGRIVMLSPDKFRKSIKGVVKND